MEEKLSDKYKKSESNGSEDSIDKNLPLNISTAHGNDSSNAPSKPASPFSSFRSSYRKPSSRETMLKLMVGATGMGKTVQIIKECQAYAQYNPITGKKARPVFIIHPNILFEPQYMNTFPNHIRKEQVAHIQKPGVYLVLPINTNGTLMTDEEKRSMTIYCVNNLKHCLAVLDDLDDCFKGAKPRDFDKLFVSHRHRGIDLITTHQFLNPITTQEWGAVTTISLRKTTQSVSIIKDRVPNPEILFISEMIVAEQFNLSEKCFREGIISEDEWKKRRSFFVEINIRTNHIIGGFSRECFIRNCKKYLNLNGGRIADFQKIYCDEDGKPKYNRTQAIERIIENELWAYFAGRE